MISSRGATKGELKKDFQVAEYMIEALENDDRSDRLYNGFTGDDVQKEMIVFGEIEGVPVKGKLDSVNLSRGYFADLKTMKSIYAEEWNTELRKQNLQSFLKNKSHNLCVDWNLKNKNK